MTNNVTIQNQIESFRKILVSGFEQIVEASRIYVAAIDQDPSCIDMFHEKLSDLVPHSAWAGFEQVGRGHMHYKLLLGGGRNGAYIKRLPVSEQTRIFNGGKVELLTVDNTSLNIDPLTCSKEQAEQVFNGPDIRTPSEQRAYIESKKAQKDAVTVKAPWIKKGNTFLVRETTLLTKRDLLAMLESI